MDFEMWAGLIALLVLVLVGVPVVFAFAASAAFGLYFVFGGFEPVVNLLQQSAISGIKDYNFVVIPLFTVMGMLIAHCGAAGDLFSVVNRMLKGIPGRLAGATVGGNAIFAAVTGVGVAAAAAFSHVAYPVMRENRYSRSFAVGCIAGSSVLGLLIPPSVFMIVWAILTEQSVGGRLRKRKIKHAKPKNSSLLNRVRPDRPPIQHRSAALLQPPRPAQCAASLFEACACPGMNQ